MAAAATRNLPTVHLDLKDLLGDAPIHSLLKAIEAAATSEVGATRLDALLVTLEVLGAEADFNAVDGSGNTAFAIGMMSSLPNVRKLVKDFKMKSKFDPLVRIDVTLDELDKVIVSDAIKREVFDSVATQAATVVLAFDISDPTDPVLVRRQIFEGSYVAARKVGAVAYLVVSRSAWAVVPRASARAGVHSSAGVWSGDASRSVA